MAEDEEVRAKRTSDLEEQVEALGQWWSGLIAGDIERTAPKAVQYGAADLDIMGQAMISMGGDLWVGVTQEEKLRIGREMACAFYACGKIARAFSAYQQGRLPQDDDWFDVSVYALMARRIRQTGSWP